MTGGIFGAFAPAFSKVWRNTHFRLLGVYTGICGAGLLILLGIVALHLTETLEHSTDTLMAWQLDYLSTLSPDALKETIAARSVSADVKDEHYGVFDVRGAHLAGDIMVRPSVPVTGKDVGWTARGLVFDRRQAGDDATRLVTLTLPDGTSLFNGRSMESVRYVRHDFVGLIVYGGLLVMVASIFMGAVYARRQTRRISEIQPIVSRISDGNLHLRLPENGPDEISALSALVNHMLDDIERLMAEVKGACDGIAHDLRTPLGQMDLLLAQIVDLANEMPVRNAGPALSHYGDRIVKAAEQAANASAHLRQRFNAILRISELNATHRRLGFARVQIRDVLRQLSELYEAVAEEKQIGWRLSLDIPADACVFGDGMLLFEAFSNIVDNAIKFTPEGGLVHIVGHLADNQCQVEFCDSGPGIRTGERHAVFERFYRQREHATLSGSGLGLSIVSAILNLHQFPFRLDDVRPEASSPGLKFSISMPVLADD